jgi:hypothetical protein
MGDLGQAERYRWLDCLPVGDDLRLRLRRVANWPSL